MMAMKQVEQMRKSGCVNMFAEADYSEGTTANMWLCNKIEEIADRICKENRQELEKFTSAKEPRHL